MRISRRVCGMSTAEVSTWLKLPIKGLLLDISGVLYDGSGPDSDGIAIPGSVDAVKRLSEARIPFRLCSNETQNTRQGLVDKLKRLGFSHLTVDQVFTPAPAVVKVIKSRNLRPFLLVHHKQLPEFHGVVQDNPNCVVVGDAAEHFTYDLLNNAFRILMFLSNPVLISMGLGKFYKETHGLMLDLGAYTKALEYACDVKAEVVGKPDPSFFGAAVEDMGLKPEEVVMIGDDIVSDVGGAQKCGMRGVQVKTGKWRDHWINHPTVKPCAILPDLAAAVSEIIKNNVVNK